MACIKYCFILVPETIKLHEKLGVVHNTLKLISPSFEAPLPPLQAAVIFISSSVILEIIFYYKIRIVLITSLTFVM